MCKTHIWENSQICRSIAQLLGFKRGEEGKFGHGFLKVHEKQK